MPVTAGHKSLSASSGIFIFFICCTMKSKKKGKKLRITEADFMLANRRAARLEEIAEHGRPVSMRTVLHKSRKVYDRKRLKKAGISNDDLPYVFCICS